MARTRFRTQQSRDIFLYRTHVENLFINEFLPDAPGDCVKVFLFGLMYAQFNEEIDSRTLALTLGMSENDVESAWRYWEERGLVRLSGNGDERIIEFIRQIDRFYGKTFAPVPDAAEPAHEEAAASDGDSEDDADEIIARLIDQQLKEIYDKYQMLTGRTLSRHEANKLADAVKVFGIEPDVLDFAISYCAEIDKSSVDYIKKVALRWTEEGCRDVASVKQMLDKHSRRSEAYRQVFSAVGFNRLPTPADREIMDRWFDELGCDIKDVLDACRATAGLREPNLRYVNKVLENKMLEQGGIDTRREAKADDREARRETRGESAEQPAAKVSRKVLKDYYDFIRAEDDRMYRERAEELRKRIPAMRDIAAAEAELAAEVVKFEPGEDAREKRQRLKARRRELEEEKRELLLDNSLPPDYLDRKYRCGICRDTGYTDEGRVCTCCQERAEEAYKWIRSSGSR